MAKEKRSHARHVALDEFKKEYNKLTSTIYKSLSNYGLTSATTYKVSRLVDMVFRRDQYRTKFTMLASKYVAKFSKSTPGMALGMHLGGPETLSLRIWKNVSDTKKAVKSVMRELLGAEGNWGKVAASISAKKMTKEILPGYLDDVLSAYRAYGVRDYHFEGAIRKARRNINRLVPGTRLQKAYSNLIKTVSAEKDLLLPKAMRRSLDARTKYIAERLTRTEMSAAYGIQQRKSIMQDENVTAWKSTLSSRHKIYDICDYHAQVDHYGMGMGIYPKDRYPNYPYHPQCTCSMTKIYVDVPRPRFDRKAGKAWLSKGDNSRVLNKKGQNVYKKRASPESMIPNYSKARRY